MRSGVLNNETRTELALAGRFGVQVDRPRVTNKSYKEGVRTRGSVVSCAATNPPKGNQSQIKSVIRRREYSIVRTKGLRSSSIYATSEIEVRSMSHWESAVGGRTTAISTAETRLLMPTERFIYLPTRRCVPLRQ